MPPPPEPAQSAASSLAALVVEDIVQAMSPTPIVAPAAPIAVPEPKSEGAPAVAATNAADEQRLAVIRSARAPVVHYKVFAGGNHPILPCFERLGETMRPQDVVLMGMFLKDDPQMIQKNVEMFERLVDKGG